MSSFASPASAIARRDDWAISAMAVLSGTRPPSDRPAPTMATRFRGIPNGYHIHNAPDNAVYRNVETVFSIG
jgi:hypothetical protein